jgi:hypothetical protein
MSLHTHAHLPSNRSYVLKLHRDAAPQRGHFCGRLEHIVSGDHVDFDSAEQLIAWLAQHAASVDTPTGSEGS